MLRQREIRWCERWRATCVAQQGGRTMATRGSIDWWYTRLMHFGVNGVGQGKGYAELANVYTSAILTTNDEFGV